MAVSLEYQTVYCPRERVTVPAYFTMFAVSLLLIALVFKIWLKVQIVDIGYEIAEIKKHNEILSTEIKELELQRSVLTRSDRILEIAAAKGYHPVQAEDVVVLTNTDV